jgi:hypothetical protein
MAKFGNQGVETFKELARIAKITGMEMEKILSITDKFDTFEGAAEQVGKINAALGGNFVNAMDMMMATDPAERFNKVRDALSQAGLSFDSMSYYQKKFFADSLGLQSVGDLALMMSGNMGDMAGATEKSAAEYEEMAAQAQAVQSVQEKFNAVIANFFMENKDMIMDFIDKLGSLLQMLLENADRIMMWMKILAAAKVAFMVWGAAIAWTNIVMAQQSLATKKLTLDAILKAQADAAAAAAASGSAAATVTKTGVEKAADVVTKGATVSTVAKTGADTASGIAAKANAIAQGFLALAFKGVGVGATLARFAMLGLVGILIALAAAMLMSSPSLLVAAFVALTVALVALAIAAPGITGQITALGTAVQNLGMGIMMSVGSVALLFAAMSLMSTGQMAGVVVMLAGIAMWGFQAGIALDSIAVGVETLGLAVSSGIGAAGLAAIVVVILAIGAAAAMAGPSMATLMQAILLATPEQLLGLAGALVVMGVAFYLFAKLLGKSGKAIGSAIKPLLVAAAVLLAIGAAVWLIGQGIQAATEGFAALLNTFTEENVALLGAFATTLSYAWAGMTLSGIALLVLSVGMLAFAASLALIKTADLRAIADFVMGVSTIHGAGGIMDVAKDLTAFGDAMETLAARDLTSPFTSLDEALSKIDTEKVSALHKMMAAITALETTGLDKLSTAFEKIAESIEKIPSSKAVMLTSTMKAATVTAKAIEVLQGRTGGAGGAAGGIRGGADTGGGGGTTKREFKVDFVLDSDIFEEHVISIIDDNVGKKTRDAINNAG